MEPEDLLPDYMSQYVTYNDYITRYRIEPDLNVKDNVNNMLVIPDNFKKVLKKTINGLDDITIENYQEFLTYNPATFEPAPKFTVRVRVTFFWDANPIPSREKLDEVINTAFYTMFIDKQYIKFSVKDIVIPKRNYEKEFIQFFIQK